MYCTIYQVRVSKLRVSKEVMHLSPPPPLPFQKVSRICSFIFISLKLRNRTTREGEEGASFKSKEIFVYPSPSFSIISQKNLLSTFFPYFLAFLSQLGYDRTDPYIHNIHTQATPRPLVRLSCQQTNKKKYFEIITLSLSHPSHTLSLYTRNCFPLGVFLFYRPN